MKTMTSPAALAVLTLALSLAGCSCEERTNRRFPKVELLDDVGNARTMVEFGQVQVNFTAKKTVRVRNGGNAALELTQATFSNAKFAAGEALPISIDVNGEHLLELTFTPTAPDVRETGTATLATNDPERPTVQLSLAGTGVTATAVLQPQALDFGDVYVGESKRITVAFTNAGSNELPVTDARLSTAVPASVTADLTPWKKTLAGGETAMVTVTFAPTAPGAISGALEVLLPAGVGDKSLVISGTGIRAEPRLCFRFEGSGVERCTDGTQALDVRFGSLCDGRVYPADGGLLCELDGGVVPYARGGQLYFKNEGNTPVSYTVAFNAGQTNRCDGGSTIDFEFANAPALPDGGTQPSWSVATTRLPMHASDPKPWETAPIAVTYRARSACRGGDDSDIATVLWTRQGEPAGTMRLPSSLVATLTGASLLAAPEPNGVTFTGNSPMPQDVTLVSNTGDGPVRLLSAALWQSSDGGLVPDEPCSMVMSGSCQFFTWLAGPTLPVVLEGTTAPGGRVQKQVGRLAYGVFEPDGGFYVPPSQPQRVFAIVETSDPYTPRVVVPIIGRLQ
jgi:hypothetical protein